MKTFIKYSRLFREDSKRYGLKKSLLFFDPRLIAIFYFRLSQYFNEIRLVYFSALIYNKLRTKYGLDIHPQVIIGGGLKIVHLGGIVIHRKAIIGNNLTILNNVTIGQKNRKDSIKVPILGDNIFLSVFSTLIGDIKVGDNVVIGAHCLVRKDVETNKKVYVKQNINYSEIIS